MKIPIWIMIWGLLMALLPLGFVAVAYFNPSYFSEEWVARGVSRLDDVYGNYVARNMASALIMIFALWQRSAAMLIVAFLMRLLSDMFDVIHLSVAGTLDLRYSLDAGILSIGCLVSIYFLWPIYKSADDE